MNPPAAPEHRPDPNPYQVSETGSPEADPSPEPSMRQLAVSGAIWSAVSAFPIAGFLALVYRFPVPFAGYMSGMDAIIPSQLSVVMYGVFLGGLPLLALGAAACGAATSMIRFQSAEQSWWAARLAGMLLCFAALFVLSILDHLIGRW